MASINKLSVRGVRSFSPDDKEQVVEFYFPCTIIVGANGCGKTTIIESLKFAVCGALPPGNRSGQAFVHDPKSIGHSDVKANIKLRITNKAGKPMVVVRSMEVSQKKTKMTFKQLDGVVRTTDEQGNRQALSHKCTELDSIIPTLLGVSKPILEHVIFCHQEDASWPLQEGAVLKKRFDDIFDSTRYSKALEVFSKQKKQYTSQAKDLKADVASFTSHRHAARGFRQEIEKYADQIEELQDKMDAAKQGLKDMSEEREEILKELETAEESRLIIVQRKNELGNLQSVVAKQREMIQEDLSKSHTVVELNEMLRDFGQQMTDQLDKKKEFEDEIQHRTKQVEAFRREQTNLREHTGRLKAEKSSHDAKLRHRYEKMVELGQKYNLESALSQLSQTQLSQTQMSSFASASFAADASQVDAPTDEPLLEINEDDMREFFRAMDKKNDEFQDELMSHKSKYQQQEDQLQNLLADLQGRQRSIESERAKVHKEQSDARKELQKISQQLSTKSRLRKADVEDAKRKAVQHAKDRDAANNDPRRIQIPTEIRSAEDKIHRLKGEIEDDQIALKDLRHSAEAQNAVAVLKEQSVKDLDTLDEIITEQDASLKRFNIAVPSELPGLDDDANGDKLSTIIDKLVDAVSSKWEALNMDASKANDEVSRLVRIVSEKNAFVTHNKHNLSAKRTRMVQLENGGVATVRQIVAKMKQMEKSLGISSPHVDETKPDELMAYITKRIQQLDSESMEGIGPETVKRIIKRLKRLSKTNAIGRDCLQCPCCARDMDTEDQVRQFVQQMDVLMAAESPLIKGDEQTTSALPKYKKWQSSLSPNLNAIHEYKRTVNEIRDIEKNMEEMEKDLAEKNRELKELKAQHKDSESEATEARDLLDSARRWSEAAGRIAEKRMQVKHKQEDLLTMSSDPSGRDLATVERQMQTKLDEKELHATQINRLNKEMTQLNTRLANLANSATKLEQLARDKEAKFADERTMTERKAVLNETITRCSKEESRLQSEIAPLRQKQRTKETEKQRLRALADEEEVKLIGKNNSFLSDYKELKKLTDDIEVYAMSGKDKELENLFTKSTALEEQCKEKQVDINKIKPELERLSKAIEDEERHKTNLRESISMIKNNERTAKMETEIEKLEEEMAQSEGHENAAEDLGKLDKKMQKLSASQARLEGRRSEIVESIRSLKRKLKQPEYKNVEEEYRVSMIKHETTLMAVRDIEKYHSALDHALLQFHSIKIAEINQIIRDLWRLTYKGEDITTIELVSGQDSGARASRSYNYRVVMTKGSTRMDMRGRCSAGQRVLASIVIRLALAETFCVNCGCIALDEPTVNLDFNNKRGLAIALAQITADRSAQSNFQLIMITHDEDFVAMMKTELASQSGFTMPEKYFQVRREEGADGKYYSKIDAIDWDELV